MSNVSASQPARVVLVGFEDQDNLGIRYLAARLRQCGHGVAMVAVTRGLGPILSAIASLQPHVVGFSLIFQYMVPEFGTILRGLRESCVTAHFTMGGHYASFRPDVLLKAIPELDSVVRFEGEDTLEELARRIANHLPWESTPGMAYRRPSKAVLASDMVLAPDPGLASETVLASPRVGRTDLDDYPWPDRTDIAYAMQRIPTASVIGGRGCPWVCSFCSIITFYKGNGTKGRRRRQPKKLVDELEYLYRDRGVRVILWQDDDFLAGGTAAIAWAHEVANECVRRNLQLRWKISCRSDEISEVALGPLIAAGLTHVYMGIESGDETNLINLNKRTKPDVHMRAARLLRALDVTFDFGFMLLEPWSTIDTVRNNLNFLREFIGDGASALSFCRALPYAGTAIEERLVAEGRLREGDFEADYAFLDPRLDSFYNWLFTTIASRNFSADGTPNLLRHLLYESRLNLPGLRGDPEFRERLRLLTALSNQLLITVSEATLSHFAVSPTSDGDSAYLHELRAFFEHEDARLRRDVIALNRSHAHVDSNVPIECDRSAQL